MDGHNDTGARSIKGGVGPLQPGSLEGFRAIEVDPLAGDQPVANAVDGGEITRHLDAAAPASAEHSIKANNHAVAVEYSLEVACSLVRSAPGVQDWFHPKAGPTAALVGPNLAETAANCWDLPQPLGPLLQPPSAW